MPDDTPTLHDFLAFLDEPVEPATYVSVAFRPEPAPRRPTYTGSSSAIRAMFERLHAGDDQCKFGSNPRTAANRPDVAKPDGRAPLDAANDDGCAVALNNTPSTSLSTSPNASPPTPSPKRSRPLQAAVDNLNPYTHSWRYLWAHQIAATSFDAVTNRPGAYAFTLNFDADREAFLSCRRGDDGAISCRRDPADDLRRYIQRELRNRFGFVFPFGFSFDVSPTTGKLHIHGVIIIPADHLKDAVRESLARAGGRIRGKAAARQVRFEPLTDGIGWAGYSMKAFDEVCGRLGTNKLAFISNELRRLGKEHRATQRAVGTPRKRAGTVPARKDSARPEARQRPSMAVSGDARNNVKPSGSRIQKNSLLATFIQPTDSISLCYLREHTDSQNLLTTSTNLGSKRILIIDNFPNMNHHSGVPLICGEPDRETFMDREIYIDDQEYEHLADSIRRAMERAAGKPLAARREEFRVLLSPLELGRADRLALIHALTTYTPAIGAPDVRDVRWLLGGVGGVFPARFRCQELSAA
ncbi:MAG: hypothetical protein WBF87_12815 [Mesorhizobium sp.]